MGMRSQSRYTAMAADASIEISKDCFRLLKKEVNRLDVSIGALIERMLEMGTAHEQMPHLVPNKLQ